MSKQNSFIQKNIVKSNHNVKSSGNFEDTAETGTNTVCQGSPYYP